MSVPDVTNTVSTWPFLPTLVRLALAIGTGAFVGLEREHRGKAGARTFTFASLIGCLGGLLGNSFALLAITLVGVFVCFLNTREWILHRNLLLTTSAALIIVVFCGVLCGKGHTFTPVATAVITAALLAWKQPITGFATGLSDIELRSAVLLAILSFIAFFYSLIPMLIMLATTAILLRLSARTAIGTTSEPPPDLKLEQPFSLKAALKFGVIFLVLSVAAVLAQRSLGVFGFYAVSIGGGLLSSASAVAAAGIAAAHREVSFPVAANGAVLASLTSVLVNIPLIARTGGQPRLTKALARTLLIVIASGIFGVFLHRPLEKAFRSVLAIRNAPTANAR